MPIGENVDVPDDEYDEFWDGACDFFETIFNSKKNASHKVVRSDVHGAIDRRDEIPPSPSDG